MHRVRPSLKVGATKFHNQDRSVQLDELELNHTIHVSCIFTLLGCGNDCRSVECGESKERLDQAPVMKVIHGKAAELVYTVDENAYRPSILNFFGDLSRHELT